MRRIFAAAIGLVAALALTSCTVVPGPVGGFKTPAPGQELDIAKIEGSVNELFEAADSEEFYELKISPYRVSLSVPAEAGAIEYVKRDAGGISSERREADEDQSPIMRSDVDIAATLAATRQSFDEFYECWLTVESVGYQGMVSTFCDSDYEQLLTTDLQPMSPDLSTGAAFSQTLALIGRGAPDSITGLDMSGPDYSRISVDFAQDGVLRTIDLSNARGMSALSGFPGTPAPFAQLDGATLYACSKKMMALSGLDRWNAWMTTTEDGTMKFYWDVHDMWDPNGTVSVTNEKCEPVAP